MAGYFLLELTQRRPAGNQHILNRFYRGAQRYQIQAPDADGVLFIWARTPDEAADHAWNALFELIFSRQRSNPELENPRCPECGSAAVGNGRTSAGTRRWRCTSEACGRRFVPARTANGGPLHPQAEKRQAFYAAMRAGEPVTAACASLGIARATGYKWRRRFLAALERIGGHHESCGVPQVPRHGDRGH